MFILIFTFWVKPEILIFSFCISKPGLIGFGYMNVSEKVSFVEEYGLQDGNIIAFNSESTPTRGRELTILQQLFGNLGRLGAGNIPGN